MVKTFKQLLGEDSISPSTTPGTMSFWHGGNLDNLAVSGKTQKAGRYEYGAGLYLTTHYDTALKYSKGSRKLYMVTVNKGNDANTVSINYENAIAFVKENVTKAKQGLILDRLQKYQDGLKAYVFNNILINNDAIKPSATHELSNFLVDEGCDYLTVNNAFGWGEKMLVVFNTKIIDNIIQVKPKDKIAVYDIPINTNF